MVEMHEISDAQLLRRYAENGDEAAFRELVVRHADLVYSAALRQVASPDLAGNVAQSVFIDLARKALELVRTQTGNASLLGWLYRSTRFAALKQLRDDRRRQAHERQVMEHLQPATGTATDWERVHPLLDEAMSNLGEEDRQALLLRFFKNRDFRAIGELLGVSDNAAQKRVSRALDKLRAEFARSGVTTTAVALSAALSANAVTAAPEGLAAAVWAAALAETTIVTAATTTTKAIAMTTMQKTLIAATVAALSGATVFTAHQAARLRADVATLRQREAPLSEQAGLLERERDAATNRLALLAGEVARLSNASAELLKLRSEVGRLRAQSQELARLKAGGPGTETGPEEGAWLERVKLLRQKLDQTPAAKIPELQFLTDFDWLMAAKHKLDTEDDYRLAFRDLRSSAIGNFVRTAAIALGKYVQAHNGQFPTDLAQLKSSFETPPSDDLLERYKIVPSASLTELDRPANSEWVIALKSPQDESNWAISPNGSHAFVDNPQMTILAPAMKAALDAAPVVNGARRLDIHQLAPYLTTPEQKAAYEELIRASK